MVALQLGVLKTGAAYANLDPGWPVERRRAILDLLAPVVVVTSGDCAVGAFDSYQPSAGGIADAARRARSFEAVSMSPDAPAMILFTSGTTGAPKCVVSPHQAVTRLFGSRGLSGFGPGHATPQVAALPWDMHAFELWGQLTTGGTVVLIPASYLMPGRLRQIIATHGVDTLWLTASLFNLFVDEDPDCFAGLTNVYTGGEKASPDHVRSFLRRHPGVPFWNTYGPAESCMITTMWRAVPGDCDTPGGLPIGTPVSGTSVAVLDIHDRRCEPREVGEICIAGAGLATGYMGQPELTQDKFPSIDLDGLPVRIYRSGDMGMWDEDGVLHYRGRRDRQIKISGLRIELAEIESVAASLPGVRNCIAFAVHGADDRPKQIALVYLVSGPDADPRAASDGDPLEVHEQLLRLLPGYMVPQIVRGLAGYPMTANGKTDLAGLQELARHTRPATGRRQRRRVNHAEDGVPVANIPSGVYSMTRDQETLRLDDPVSSELAPEPGRSSSL
jgi:amino acid adenylation domain-containing protein